MFHRSYVVNFLFSLSFLTFLSVISTEDEYCGKPGAPYNGHYVPLKSQYDIGETVLYSCDDETYSLVGQYERECLLYAMWGHQIPTCEKNLALRKKVEHATKAVVDNRMETFFNLARGDSIIVDLGQEFDISYVTIAINQYQSYSFLIDVIEESSSIKRRCMDIRDQPLDNDFKFVCNNGSKLCGQYVAITDKSSSFVSSSRIYEIGVYSGTGDTKCGDPDVPSHGSVHRKSVDVAVYTCDDNYLLMGGSLSNCEDGRWTPNGQYCVLNPDSWVGCGEPAIPSNGDRYVFGKLQNEWIYVCNKGFVLDGFQTRVCRQDGLWAPQRIPKCVTNFAYNKMAKHQNVDIARRTDSVDGNETTCEFQKGQFYGYIDLGEPISFDRSVFAVKSDTRISISIFITNDTRVSQPNFNNKSALMDYWQVDDVQLKTPLTLYGPMEVARFIVIYLSKSANVCEVTVHNSNEVTSCGQPDQPMHGGIKLRNSTLTIYECNFGFRLIGDSVTFCVNGRWNLGPPKCIYSTTLTPTSTTQEILQETSEILQETPETQEIHSKSEDKNESVTLGIMGIILGATIYITCYASFMLFYICRRIYHKRKSRINRDQSFGKRGANGSQHDEQEGA